MIIDGHAHLWDTEFGNADELLRQLDLAGIDRAVCVPGGMIDIRQFSRVLSGRVQPNQTIPNHLVFDAISQHSDRLYGFVCINPKDPRALSMLREGFDRGCRGVKLAPIVHPFLFNEPVLDEVTEECGRYGFPVYTHVVPQPGDVESVWGKVLGPDNPANQRGAVVSPGYLEQLGIRVDHDAGQYGDRCVQPPCSVLLRLRLWLGRA
jgi:predicted TIM-barrel fold metal-dependent hydrolase